MTRLSIRLVLWWLAFPLILPNSATVGNDGASLKPVQTWRFSDPGQLLGWAPNAHMADIIVANGRLCARAVGADPILLGPIFSLEATPTQQIEFRMTSNRSGDAELFWTETLKGKYGGFSQQKSVRFSVLGDGRMHIYRIRPFWHKAGHIVRLRFDPPADASIQLESIGIVDDVSIARSMARSWQFHNDARDWHPDQGIASFSATSNGLRITSATGTATLISPVINITAAEHPIVAVRMTVSQGTTGTIYCASNNHFGWRSVSFAIRADGRMHTYNIDMSTLAAWSDQIIMLGVGPSDAPGAIVTIESVEVAREPCGPAELEIVYLGPADGINRVGRPATVVCQVRNLGGTPAEKVFATLSGPDSVTIISPARQPLDPISLDLPKQVTWKLKGLRVGSIPIRVRITAAGVEPATAEAAIHMTPVPVLPGEDPQRPGRAAKYVPAPDPVRSRYQIGAFYFPGWSDMARWRPILDYPMRKPVLGWYDESNPECADWQIKWAVEHGVDFFMVDWYWSQGHRQLEHWLQSAYMKARYRKHLKWAVMWANHNPPGTHSVEDWKNVTQYWINHYFHMDEYYRIDGRPAVFIWAPANIRRDVGGTEKAAELYAMSRKMARAAGLPGIYFVAMSSHESEANCRQLKAEGYEAFTSYHTFQLAAARAGHRNFGYEEVVKTSPEVWRAADARRAGLDYYPVVDTGWDSRPWHKNKARVVYGRTPELFGQLCRAVRTYADQNKKNIVVLGPWNEWGEGSYIEPYAENGFADLDALRSAFCEPGDYPPNLVPSDVGRGPYDLPPVATKTSWEFNTDGDAEGWSPSGGLDAQVRGGMLVGRSTTADPIIAGPPVQIDARRMRTLRLRMRSSKNDRAQLFWATQISAQGETQSVHIDLIGDGKFHEYRVNLGTNVRWRGAVTALRLDPAVGPGTDFAIDFISFGP